MTTYTVTVKMADGEKMDIKNVTDFGWKKDFGCVTVTMATG